MAPLGVTTSRSRAKGKSPSLARPNGRLGATCKANQVIANMDVRRDPLSIPNEVGRLLRPHAPGSDVQRRGRDQPPPFP